MLEKVFYNLRDNTLRHGKEATQISVSYQVQEDGGCIIYWQDNGIGIPNNQKQRIFEKGFGKNTGLGLFLALEILGITGITMQETGVFGLGARFEIFIPKGRYRIESNQ